MLVIINSFPEVFTLIETRILPQLVFVFSFISRLFKIILSSLLICK